MTLQADKMILAWVQPPPRAYTKRSCTPKMYRPLLSSIVMFWVLLWSSKATMTSSRAFVCPAVLCC